ncbi:MAG: hypothetical protein M3367_00495 [Acidobacteriota bacterium]|nr:hypothetical protein [Acidobacteriota bacterium]
MWEKIYNALSTLITIGVEVEKHEKEIDLLRTEMRQVSAMLHEVLAELRNVKQQRESDRREVNLFVENEMLKFERRLPPGKEENEK